jgi:hypothetical protein
MKNIQRRSIPLLAVAIIACVPARGQDAKPQETRPPEARPTEARPTERKRFAVAGIWELGGSATFQRSVPVVNGVEGDAVYTLSALPYVGWFVIDGLELGVNPLGVSMTKTEQSTVVDLRFLFAPSWNFRMNGEWYPFAEGLVGYTARITSGDTGDTTDDGVTYGGRVGVKFRVAQQGLLTVGVQYLAVTLDPSNAQNRHGSNDIAASVGFSVWL